MNQAYKRDIGALIRPYPALLQGTSATSGTPITTGRVVDRALLGYARSAQLVVNGTYTVASGAAGDTITVAGTIKSAASLNAGALVSPNTEKTFSVTVPWVSNASGREFSVAVGVGLASAGEYVQLSSLTLTAASAGGTYSALSVGALWVFGGEKLKEPDPLYVPAGYLSFGT